MNTFGEVEHTSTETILSLTDTNYPTGFVLESPSSSESPYLPTTQPLAAAKRDNSFRRDKHRNRNVNYELALPKETSVAMTSPKRKSDTRINIISNDYLHNSAFSPFLGQSGKELESVRVYNDTGKAKAPKKPVNSSYRPANGHSVKRQQKCSDIEREVTNCYRRCTVLLYVLAALATIATVTLWLLTCTHTYTTERNVLAWSVTMSAICLVVIAIFSDIRERRHRQEMKEIHRERGHVNRTIYLGPHPGSLNHSEKALKNGSKL